MRRSAGVGQGEGMGRWLGSGQAFPVSKSSLGKELPVPWSWRGARCLPGLVHVKVHCLAFHSLPNRLSEVLMTTYSQNNTQRCFFQLRSAESCYLPISHWRPPRALVIPGSPRPECDPTGRFPRHLERTPDVPCQLTGLLTASFQRAPAPLRGFLCLSKSAERGCNRRPRAALGMPRALRDGEDFPRSWRADVERESAFGSRSCNWLGLPFSFCGQKKKKERGEGKVYLFCILLLRANLETSRPSSVKKTD